MYLNGIERGRGGKINDRMQLLNVILTGGQIHDSKPDIKLLKSVALKAKKFLRIKLIVTSKFAFSLLSTEQLLVSWTKPISGDIPTTGKYNFPQLARVNYLPEETVYPFNYLKSIFPHRKGCFIKLNRSKKLKKKKAMRRENPKATFHPSLSLSSFTF